MTLRAIVNVPSPGSVKCVVSALTVTTEPPLIVYSIFATPEVASVALSATSRDLTQPDGRSVVSSGSFWSICSVCVRQAPTLPAQSRARVLIV